MSDYSIVPNAALTATADAIRTKSGSQATIEFDHNTGFKDAVDALPSGGIDQISAMYDGTLTSVTVTSVLLGRSIFRGYTPLVEFHAPNAERFEGGYTVYGTSLTTLALPKIKRLLQFAPLGNNTKLTTLDLGPDIYEMSGSAFNGNTIMNTLIIRSSTIPALGGTGAFTGTPFASGGTGGTIYIPKSLYDALGTGTNDYKAATNWSVIDGYGTITWAKIEGSQYENYYADGTPIPTT